MHIAKSLSLVLLLAVGTSGIQAAKPVVQVKTTDAITLNLKPYFRGFRTLDVQIGGKTRCFLFDTGGGSTAVSLELARELGWKPWGRSVGHRMNGEAVTFQIGERLDGKIGEWKLSLDQAYVFDLQSLLPKELPPLDGVISLDSLKGQVFTLDWATNRLILHPKDSIDAAIKKYGMEYRLQKESAGAAMDVFIPVQCPKGKLWFLLDSGNIQGTLISSEIQKQGLVIVNKDGKASLKVAHRAEEVLPVIEAKINYDGVLGIHYLERGPVTLDLRGVK